MNQFVEFGRLGDEFRVLQKLSEDRCTADFAITYLYMDFLKKR